MSPAARPITGRTTVAAVIGNPVGHSLSPALHNAGFASLGLDWVYAAFEVAEGAAADALAAMRTLGLGGLSVTMPHKHAVAKAVDVLDPSAAALDSVNTVARLPDGRLAGYSTDGDGFVASMAAAGHDLAGCAVAVLGAGGAARSIVEAVARHGAHSVVVVNRSPAPATAAAALAGAAGSVGGHDDFAAADVIVNATPVGMAGRAASGAPTTEADLPLDPDVLRARHVVVDIVYHPRRTALLVAAEAAGAMTVDGLGMLVHQAVLQQVLWTGLRPDPDVLLAAAEHELARSAAAAHK